LDRFKKRISLLQKIIYITHEVQLLLRYREHSSSPLQRLIGMHYFGTVYSVHFDCSDRPFHGNLNAPYRDKIR